MLMLCRTNRIQIQSYRFILFFKRNILCLIDWIKREKLYIKRIVNDYGKNICTTEILQKLGRKVIGSANVKKITKVRKIDLFLKFPKLNFINKRRIQNILFLLNDCIDCKAQNLIHQSDGSYSKICLPNHKCVYALRYSFVYH